MSSTSHIRTSVSLLLGAPILDPQGAPFGRVREFAVSPQVEASRVEALVVRLTRTSRKATPTVVPITLLFHNENGNLQLARGAAPAAMAAGDNFLLLERDLLDQQIIDVHGHKVVRVNDVDLVWEHSAGKIEGGPRELILRIAEVEVGLRGAVRRMLKGLPVKTVNRVACTIPSSVIPWDFVDLIDRDPARRVRLKIEQERLSGMHPSDLAAILEELAPTESSALFSSLDEEVAAEALEEVELKTQMVLIEALDSERVAGILEEMDPGAAAELLAELPDERSDAILEEMNERDRHDVEELLDAEPDSAGSLMTTDFIALFARATVADAIRALAKFEGDTESVTDIFILNDDRGVECIVPLSRMLLSAQDLSLGAIEASHIVTTGVETNNRKVAELFDKYNLRCLPVVDEEHRMVGVVHAEDVIAWLRTK